MHRWFLVLTAVAQVGGAAPSTKLLASLPLRFEQEQGRAGRYAARGAGFTLHVAPSENFLEWVNAGQTAQVRTRFVGGDAKARLEPVQRLDGVANYFVGAKQNWKTDVPGFGALRSNGVYAGIDLVFHGEKRRLEYDLIVRPYSDPRAIKMEITGHQEMRVDQGGDLVISTSAGEIRWKRPEIYQDLNGVRTPIAGGFLVHDRLVKFEIGAYDARHDLVIDPTLNYSTYLGGSGDEVARGIGVDGVGNVYIAGQTNSTNLPTVNGFQMNFGGATASIQPGDGFVAKFSPAGAPLYLTYIGGSLDEGVAAIAVDTAGNAYLTGSTQSADFPVVNAYQSTFGGMGGNLITRTGDAFISKLNPTGNQLLYSTFLGGRLDDSSFAIAIDSTGSAYIAGATRSIDFPITTGAYQNKMHGVGGEPIKPCCNAAFWDPGDAFVAKLDPTGSQLIFSTYLGGSLDDVAFAIGLDSSDNVYVGGCSISSDFPTTSGALQRIWNGVDPQNFFLNFGDGFITKLNPTGSALIYSTYFGGAGDDCVNALVVDNAGSVYLTGSTSSFGLPVSQGALQPAYSGYQILPLLIEQLYGDAFVAKLNPTGSGLTYMTYLGGSMNDSATALAVDGAGNAYVVGWSESNDFPVAGGPYQPRLAGDGGQAKYVNYGDTFLAVVNPTGTGLIYSSYFGGSKDDIALGIALDSTGHVYMTGNTLSTNYPVTANAAQSTYGGQNVSRITKGDAFYTVFSGLPLTPPTINLVANAEGEAPTIAPNTWVEIKGSNLAPDARTWAASDFTNNQLPTSLDGVSVKINGQNAYVYYISGNQINVLTRADLASGPAQVVVTNNQLTTSTFTATAQAISPSFFVINGGPYVVATHLNGTLIGPTTLYPGSTTPAQPGETIVLYANGFGATNTPVVPGAETQTGNLQTLPQVQIGGLSANVRFAGLVSPGLFQFNVDVPNNLPSGDNPIIAQYNNLNTQTSIRITIQ